VKEFLALAKQKPGQLIFGATGIGATPHLATELFRLMADIDIKIVQFKGSGPQRLIEYTNA
jgi:tripartite-type tricarboxylate transporter receptor subunit TctC